MSSADSIVTLLAGIIIVLGGVGGLVWRIGIWVNRLAGATRDNTRAMNHLTNRVDALEKKI